MQTNMGADLFEVIGLEVDRVRNSYDTMRPEFVGTELRIADQLTRNEGWNEAPGFHRQWVAEVKRAEKVASDLRTIARGSFYVATTQSTLRLASLASAIADACALAYTEASGPDNRKVAKARARLSAAIADAGAFDGPIADEALWTDACIAKAKMRADMHEASGHPIATL